MFTFPISFFTAISTDTLTVPNSTYIYLSPNHLTSSGNVTQLTNTSTNNSIQYNISTGTAVFNTTKQAPTFSNTVFTASSPNANSLITNTAFSIYLVFELISFNSAGTTYNGDGIWHSNDGYGGITVANSANNNIGFYNYNSGIYLTSTATTDVRYLLTITFNASTLTYNLNDVTVATANTSSIDINSMGVTTLGKGYGSYGNFYLYSFITSNSFHDTTTQNSIKNYLLNTYNIKIPTSSIVFDSLGGNDIFYYLGTNKNNNTWVNPQTRAYVNVTASSIASGSVLFITDRTNSDFFTSSVANSWIKFNFGINKINPNYYVIKSRTSAASNLPRNWILQGSNDNSNWTDLDTRINDTSLTTTDQYAGFSCTSSSSYQYIRLLNNGVDSSGANYLTIGEFYLYGTIN